MHFSILKTIRDWREGIEHVLNGNKTRREAEKAPLRPSHDQFNIGKEKYFVEARVVKKPGKMQSTCKSKSRWFGIRMSWGKNSTI